MSRCKEPVDLAGVDDALGKLLAAQLALGKEALKLLGTGYRNVRKSLGGLELPKGASCCDKPEPCWMPKKVAEVCCDVAPEDVGEICILISNEDFRSHTYTLAAAGEHSSLVQFSNQQFNLGPKERRSVSAKFKMPARDIPKDESCCELNDYELVLWIKGCQQHYIKWHLNAAKKNRQLLP